MIMKRNCLIICVIIVLCGLQTWAQYVPPPGRGYTPPSVYRNPTFPVAHSTSVPHAPQKTILKSGSFDFLQGQEVIFVKYDYSNLAVGEYDNEDDYIAYKISNFSASNAEKAENWKASWYGDRTARFEPKFEELFNKYIKSLKLEVRNTTMDAKYQLVVHTTFIEPGYNVYLERHDALINAEIIFSEIATGTVLANLTIENCPGVGGMDFDTGYRIQEAYAKLGKSVARYIVGKLK
jgi:hypothetical protein